MTHGQVLGSGARIAAPRHEAPQTCRVPLAALQLFRVVLFVSA